MISVHRDGILVRGWCGGVTGYDDTNSTIDVQGLEEVAYFDCSVCCAAFGEGLVECLVEFLERGVMRLEGVHHQCVVLVKKLNEFKEARRYIGVFGSDIVLVRAFGLENGYLDDDATHAMRNEDYRAFVDIFAKMGELVA